MESERIAKPPIGASGLTISTLVCPRCACENYYDCTPQVAWCWTNGRIEIGGKNEALLADKNGAIQIACGPRFALKGRISAAARHGRGESAGTLLVPGVPEAEGQRAKGDALRDWLVYFGKRKSKDGVIFATCK